MRTKATFRLPPELTRRLADYAARKRVSQAVVIEAALESYLSPDGPERLEAALARRLDRLSRASERLERHITIGNEALALFVRFWLTSTPPLPESLQGATSAKGKDRYAGFIEALGRRVTQGRLLADDIATEMPGDRD
ncbi:CopG family transcriptional regulator [Roseococcus thiosulfatophilus]|uniref:CopG family transcriptional regulator n=1 Tax=Roseococcus thiosulfatophilus TaxID=35813 RepID=UPI001A8CDA46|nr:CopG family transcriptional regulator [Roseococcus thiosulfatophilus]